MDKFGRFVFVGLLAAIIVALLVALDVGQVLYLAWAGKIIYGWFFLPYGFAPIEYFVFVGAIGLVWVASFRFDKQKTDMKTLKCFGRRLLRAALFPLVTLSIFWPIKYFFM